MLHRHNLGVTNLEYTALVAQGRDPVREQQSSNCRPNLSLNGLIYNYYDWTMEIANSPQMWGLIVYNPNGDWVAHLNLDCANLADAFDSTLAYINQMMEDELSKQRSPLRQLLHWLNCVVKV